MAWKVWRTLEFSGKPYSVSSFQLSSSSVDSNLTLSKISNIEVPLQDPDPGVQDLGNGLVSMVSSW